LLDGPVEPDARHHSTTSDHGSHQIESSKYYTEHECIAQFVAQHTSQCGAQYRTKDGTQYRTKYGTQYGTFISDHSSHQIESSKFYTEHEYIAQLECIAQRFAQHTSQYGAQHHTQLFAQFFA
jgi:hypothetical protein